MAELLGGFDQKEIDLGFKKLSEARNIDVIKTLIHELPVLSSPIFHAYFRQQRLGLGQNLESASGFMQTYDAVFTLLHYEVYFKETLSPGKNVVGNDLVYAPAFFLLIDGLLKDKLPFENGPTYSLINDHQKLQEEIAQLIGTKVQLPAYEAQAGALWSAIIVACSNCSERRVIFRANYVDLNIRKELIEKIHFKQINHNACESCG